MFGWDEVKSSTHLVNSPYFISQAAQVVLLEKRHALDDKEIRVSTAQKRGDGSVPQERLPADKFRQGNDKLFLGYET